VYETPLDELQKYLNNQVYPAKKELVLETAQRNGAPQATLERLQLLHSRVAGPHEVLIALRAGGWAARDKRPA
jgi:hypothetical protein